MFVRAGATASGNERDRNGREDEGPSRAQWRPSEPYATYEKPAAPVKPKLVSRAMRDA
jgi:hypothetical protein